jgi:hypothetical protein
MEEFDHPVSQTTGGCKGERETTSRAVENEGKRYHSAPKLADRYL